jgi:hypothetical protein
MHATARPKITVTANGTGVVNHVGARLLTDLAQVTGLSAAMLRGQRQLFGPVASDPTVWRVLDGLDQLALQRLAAARAAAREVAWAQRYDTCGDLPASWAGDWRLPGLVLDIDASIVVCHSEKENATPTWSC